MWVSRVPATAAATVHPPHFATGFRKFFATTSSISSYQAAPIFNTTSPYLSSSPSRYCPGSGLCQLVLATKGDTTTESLSSSKDGTSVETVKRVIEMANRALLRREILYTDFLTPPLLRDSMLALEKLADIRAVRHGGYPEAERCRISVEHQDVKANNDADVVVALSITGNFKFQACNHGDFLGSVLGTGISREKVGDIILQGEKGAQIIVVPELADFIITSLDKVGNVSVSCTRISLDELEYEPPNTKTFKTVEASIRLDALASAGFKISRTKLVDLISKGDVRVNWNTALKNGAILRIGDVVSVSGMGRLKIGEINVTKKGKYSVELIRSFEVYGVYCYVTLSRLTAY
ncbi:hypothetical protein V2J09_007338 [Rumex salicifolius]